MNLITPGNSGRDSLGFQSASIVKDEKDKRDVRDAWTKNEMHTP